MLNLMDGENQKECVEAANIHTGLVQGSPTLLRSTPLHILDVSEFEHTGLYLLGNSSQCLSNTW